MLKSFLIFSVAIAMAGSIYLSYAYSGDVDCYAEIECNDFQEISLRCDSEADWEYHLCSAEEDWESLMIYVYCEGGTVTYQSNPYGEESAWCEGPK